MLSIFSFSLDDATRVILDQGSHKQYSDYINANYIHVRIYIFYIATKFLYNSDFMIQGYLKEKAYIATQGPLPGTIVDFWRMIWQEKVHIICMLVDLFEDGEVTTTQKINKPFSKVDPVDTRNTNRLTFSCRKCVNNTGQRLMVQWITTMFLSRTYNNVSSPTTPTELFG